MFRKFTIIVCAAFLATIFIVNAAAEEMDAILIKTNGPIEFPGVVVGPGTYTLRFLDSAGGNSVVQLVGQKGTGYGFFPVRPVTRLQPTGNVQVDLKPQAGSPPRVKDWFMAGSDTGYEPVYPASHHAAMKASTGVPLAGN